MKRKFILSFSFSLLCIILVFQYSCTKDVAPISVTAYIYPCDTATIKYSTDIQPIIQSNCAISGCHVRGGLGSGNFTLYSAISADADPPIGNGAIRARVLNGGTSSDGSSGWMPAGNPLPLIDREKVDCWLKAGAPNN